MITATAPVQLPTKIVCLPPPTWRSEPRPMPTVAVTPPRNCWDPRALEGSTSSRFQTRDGQLLITLPDPDSPIQ